MRHLHRATSSQSFLSSSTPTSYHVTMLLRTMRNLVESHLKNYNNVHSCSLINPRSEIERLNKVIKEP